MTYWNTLGKDGVMKDEGQWVEELKWQKARDRFLKEIKLDLQLTYNIMSS